jgi:hypothetical protein
VTIALGSQVLHYDRAHDGIGHGGLLACIYIVKKTENVVGWCAAQNLPCVLCALVFPGVCVCVQPPVIAGVSLTIGIRTGSSTRGMDGFKIGDAGVVTAASWPLAAEERAGQRTAHHRASC